MTLKLDTEEIFWNEKIESFQIFSEYRLFFIDETGACDTFNIFLTAKLMKATTRFFYDTVHKGVNCLLCAIRMDKMRKYRNRLRDKFISCC